MAAEICWSGEGDTDDSMDETEMRTDEVNQGADVLSPGLGPLEEFVGAKEGVALKDMDGKYWSVEERHGIYNIEAFKKRKDHLSRFIVERAGDTKVYLKDQRGIYLSRIRRGSIDFIEAAKNPADVFCQFEVFYKNGKVAFRADNGLFLSLNYRHSLNIEALKQQCDEFCKFTPVSGEIIRTKFEILSVDFQVGSNIVYMPVTVKEQIFSNRSSVGHKHKFNPGFTTTLCETTSWETAWGLKASLALGCEFDNAEISVTYSGSRFSRISKQKSFALTDETEITVPPQTKITVKLMVYKAVNVSLPFVAKIKKTKNNKEEQILTEKGTWNGVILKQLEIEIKEEKIWNVGITAR